MISQSALISSLRLRILVPERKEFLSGTKIRNRRLEISALWEIINQCWFEVRYKFDSMEEAVTTQRVENHQISMHLRMEL